MKHQKKLTKDKIIRFIPSTVCVLAIFVLAIYLISSGDKITAETILSHTPSNLGLAVLFFLLLYVIKTLTIVFPILALQIAVGLVFPGPVALIVNFVGVIITLIIPYFVGLISGVEAVSAIRKRKPKVDFFLNSDVKDNYFLMFFLRVIYCLPGDVISIYYGTVNTPFLKYFIVSFVGMIPGTILSTLIGENASNPTSPVFWVSIIIIVLISVVSGVIYSEKSKGAREPGVPNKEVKHLPSKSERKQENYKYY